MKEVENLKGFLRYLVGDWRVICDIVVEEVVIHVIDVGHRREVYK
ncbi:MAG TPA: type II toxin-antitoxin system RelE/ParE family toxin [Candidatus Ornithospirochaeta avicola]|uniref:Type II toxin-antitoxin system RelE/ParE family toxin n=1 Tax=Candidatus Ornithospirochaeta avicola TaxID=2840896 RepID=A0A9D1PUD1_9SPIO|nr:type II toxin-antitoxin system RelE/ParE family toxin [Candidatus Ornithospirochaeta avicola]